MFKSLKDFIVYAVLLTALITFPVFSQVYIYASDASEDSEEKETLTYSTLAPELYHVSGPYAIDRYTGDIYYFPDYGKMSAGGIANDGYAYDEHGRQINTLTYVKEKYAEQAESESDEICFDSVTDITLYIDMLMMEEANAQSQSTAYYTKDNGYAVKKADLYTALKPAGEEYQALIKERASFVDTSLSISEQINSVTDIVCSIFSYDSLHHFATLEEAVRDGKGVCFHYVRIMNDILDELGIENEPVMGTCKGGSSHAWIQVKDSNSGRWLYIDPTAIDAYGVWHETDYENYLEKYTQKTIY